VKHLISVATGLVAVGFALACTGSDSPPPPAAPACDLTVDNLAGRTFIRQIPKDQGDGFDPDKLARMRFVQDGDSLKVKYNVRSLASVYDYTCKKVDTKKLDCLQDKPDLHEFCLALWANVGDCTADQMAAVTGYPADDPDIKKAVDSVAATVKKLKPAELDKTKAAYNSPNVQLRGVLHLSVKATDDECRLSVSDLYQNFQYGKEHENENIVGMGARFVETKNDYVFEDCKDMANLVATPDATSRPKPGETQLEWAPNSTVTFRYVGDASAKPENGCTYTMDTWFDAEPRGTAVPVSADGNGRLDWSFPVAISGDGRKVGTLYRYKACGGQTPQLIDVSCQQVKVE